MPERPLPPRRWARYVGQRHALDVAGVGHRHDHVLARDQLLDVGLELVLFDRGAARRGELLLHLDQFVAQDLVEPLARAAGCADTRGSARRSRSVPHAIFSRSRPVRRCRRRSRMAFAWVSESGIGRRPRPRPGSSIRRSAVRRRRPANRGPSTASRAVAGSAAARINWITGSRLATAMARPTNTWARSRALPSSKMVRRVMTSSRKATKAAMMSRSGIISRPAAVQRQHVDAEAGLQRRVAVELVEHDVGHGVALDLDDDAHAVAVGFVAEIGDAFDALVAHQLGDLLDHPRLVHLIGHFGDDDRRRGPCGSPRYGSGRAG